MITTLGVHIKVADLATSKAFYLALGFAPIFEYGPGTPVAEDYSGITFQHGTALLEIASGHRAVKPEIFQEHVTSPKISLMINVDSLTDIIAKAKAANIPLAVGPRHYYWGKLELVIKDPDGVVLVFTCPYSPQEALLIGADESFAIKPT